VYIEAIFGPTDAVRAGASWEEAFNGCCDGAQQAWEEHGVRVNLTPDIGRQYTLEDAEQVAAHAIPFRDRGVVGLGLGGLEAGFPPEPFARVFAEARGRARFAGGRPPAALSRRRPAVVRTRTLTAANRVCLVQP
jgi:aminodeoxyfutalosine deaminase